MIKNPPRPGKDYGIPAEPAHANSPVRASRARRALVLLAALVTTISLGAFVETPEPVQAAGNGVNEFGVPVDPRGASRFAWRDCIPASSPLRGEYEDITMDVNCEEVDPAGGWPGAGSGVGGYFPVEAKKKVAGAEENRLKYWRYLDCAGFGGANTVADVWRNGGCGKDRVTEWAKANCHSRGWTANPSDFNGPKNATDNEQSDGWPDSAWFAIGRSDVPYKYMAGDSSNQAEGAYYYWTAGTVGTNRWSAWDRSYGHWHFCERFHTQVAETIDDSPVVTLVASSTKAGEVYVDTWSVDRNYYSPVTFTIKVGNELVQAATTGNLQNDGAIAEVNRQWPAPEADKRYYIKKQTSTYKVTSSGVQQVCVVATNRTPTAPVYQNKVAANTTKCVSVNIPTDGGGTGGGDPSGNSVTIPGYRDAPVSYQVQGNLVKDQTKCEIRTFTNPDGSIYAQQVCWNNPVTSVSISNPTGTYGDGSASGGRFTFQPNAANLRPYTFIDVSDTYTYTARYAEGESVSGTITVLLPADRFNRPLPPTVNGEQITVHQAEATVPVLANDADAYGYDLELRSVKSVSNTAGMTSGEATLDGNNIIYTPPAQVPVSFWDIVTYEVCAGSGLCSTGTLQVYVWNDAPNGTDRTPDYVLMRGKAVQAFTATDPVTLAADDIESATITGRWQTGSTSDIGTGSCATGATTISCSWTPPRRTTGKLILTFTVTDSLGATRTINSKTITILPVRPS